MLVSHLNQTAKSRLAEVVEARTQLREAVQTSNQANVIWWMKELTLRQACLRRATDDAEWAAGRPGPPGWPKKIRGQNPRIASEWETRRETVKNKN